MAKGQYTNDKGQFDGRVSVHPARLDIPLKRRKPTVYAVWNDLFHEAVPGTFIQAAYATMAQSRQQTFLVLTKRPKRMCDIHTGFGEVGLTFREGYGAVLPNVYHGLTVCNQQEADEKIPIFLQVPGKKFLSIEPALGNVSLWDTYLNVKLVEYFDLIIWGAETGAKARPAEIEWFETIRDECEVAGTPIFLKQLDKKRNRVLDGATYDDLPWRA
jgi:protein gp37